MRCGSCTTSGGLRYVRFVSDLVKDQDAETMEIEREE